MQWKRVKLGDVCEFQYGKSLPKEKRNEHGKIPVYGSNGIVGYHDKFVVDQPCLIIGRKGSTGEVHFSEGPCFPIDTTYYIVSNGIDLRFFYYQLKDLGLNSLEKSTSIPGLNRNDAYQKEIILPPVPTQRAIAARLDRADALRQKDRQLLQAYDDLAQAVFVEMFGDPVRNEKGWEMKYLNKICNFSQGVQVPLEDHYLDYKEGLNRFLRISDYTTTTETRYVQENNLKYWVMKDDIVMVRYGASAGFVGVGKEGILANNLFKLNHDRKIVDTHYLFTLLQSGYFKKFIEKIAFGAAMPALSFSVLNNFAVAVPPLPLQTRFASILANIEQQKELVRQQQAESEALFGRLLQEAFEN